MNIAILATLLLVAAALIGVWRSLRDGVAHRALRIVLQIASAVLIYLCLFPPSTSERFYAGALVVLTPGASEEQLAKLSSATTVALPGVPAPTGVERVPDLGTALRRHPGRAHLRVVGGGLPARDIDAARGLSIKFDASAPPPGIVELAAPSFVRAGSEWTVRGRVEGDANGRIELRDPSGATVANANLSDDGAFALSARAKTAGGASFLLRALDHDGRAIDEAPLPIVARDGNGLRVVLIGGAPDPDLKYLRRWALDAGVELASRMALSDGVAMNEGAATLTREALDNTDLVIVDERSWATLDGAAKARITDAVRAGLGLLLRVTGPVPDAIAADWQTLGFRVHAADVAQTVVLAKEADAPELSRRAVSVDAEDAITMLRAADGSPLAAWRNEGQGRVGVWWLADSYRLSLAGDPARFGTLWSDALTTIARARGESPPEIPAELRVDQRAVFCGLHEGAFVEEASGAHVALSIDVSGAHCAAYWPAQSGWQTLVSDAKRWPFRVRDSKEAIALAAAQNAVATRSLVGHGDPGSAMSTERIPLPRWPFFLAWLGVAAALWWLERSRPIAAE